MKRRLPLLGTQRQFAAMRKFDPLSGHSGLWQAARLADLWVHPTSWTARSSRAGRRDPAQLTAKDPGRARLQAAACRHTA